MNESIFIIGLVLLFVIILSAFGYLVYKIFVDERVRSRYESLLSKSYDANDKLMVDKFNLIETAKMTNEKNLLDSTNDKKLIAKLISDCEFYVEVDKREIMAKKDIDKRKKIVRVNIKDGKDSISK